MEENPVLEFSKLDFHRKKWGGEQYWFSENTETKRGTNGYSSGVGLWKPKNPIKNRKRTDPVISKIRLEMLILGNKKNGFNGSLKCREIPKLCLRRIVDRNL